MAKRMFSKAIVDNDIFLDMPLSAQGLYFHLSMHADDYGFVSPKKVMRMIGANEDDLRILIAKRYILVFDSGVVVIKHWLINNTIRKDRSTDTTFQNELQQLTTNEFGAYTEKSRIAKNIELLEKGIENDDQINENQKSRYNTPVTKTTTLSFNNLQHSTDIKKVSPENGNQMSTQSRLDKNRVVNKVPKGTYVELQKQVRLVYDLFIEKFNKNQNQYKLSNQRILKIKARLKDAGLEMLNQAIQNTANNGFYRGDNDRGWQADLDFIIRSYEQVEKLANMNDGSSITDKGFMKLTEEEIKKYA